MAPGAALAPRRAALKGRSGVRARWHRPPSASGSRSRPNRSRQSTRWGCGAGPATAPAVCRSPGRWSAARRSVRRCPTRGGVACAQETAVVADPPHMPADLERAHLPWRVGRWRRRTPDAGRRQCADHRQCQCSKSPDHCRPLVSAADGRSQRRVSAIGCGVRKRMRVRVRLRMRRRLRLRCLFESNLPPATTIVAPPCANVLTSPCP